MRLVVFFSRGMSLQGWHDAGILDRELALYRAMIGRLDHLAFLTYGGSRDVTLAQEHIPQADVLPNVDEVPPNRYSLSLLWTHRRELRRATVFKTNQINGAWSAVLAKYLFHKKLVVRCGFLWTQSALSADDSWLRRTVVTRLERWIFRAADRVIVAAAAHRTVVEEVYGVASDRIHVIPNFVDTAHFHPRPDVPVEAGRVIYVGRLSSEKNPALLLDAIEGMTDVSLVMIGDGPLRAELEASAAARGLRVEFRGIQPHDALPIELSRSMLFVMPSQYEGNPKALLEAMAAGVPVVGTRVRGIQDVVAHGATGWLCEPNPESMRSVIRAALADASGRARVAAAALEYVRDTCSLEHVISRERAILDFSRHEVGGV